MAGSSSGHSIAPLAPDLPLVSCLAQDSLREIEPFLGLCQLLPEILEIMFQHLDPGRYIARRRLRTSGTYLCNLDDRVRKNCGDWDQWAEKLRIHEPIPRSRRVRSYIILGA